MAFNTPWLCSTSRTDPALVLKDGSQLVVAPGPCSHLTGTGFFQNTFSVGVTRDVVYDAWFANHQVEASPNPHRFSYWGSARITDTTSGGGGSSYIGSLVQDVFANWVNYPHGTRHLWSGWIPALFPSYTVDLFESTLTRLRLHLSYAPTSAVIRVEMDIAAQFNPSSVAPTAGSIGVWPVPVPSGCSGADEGEGGGCGCGD